MSESFYQENIGPFTADIYGSGSPVTVCMQGLGGIPQDFAKFASRRDGTTYILDNPLYARNTDEVTIAAKTRKNGITAMLKKRLKEESGTDVPIETAQQWLRQEYVKVCNDYIQPDFALGHSCGSLDALMIAKYLETVKGIIMLTPPYGKPDSEKIQPFMHQYGLIDYLHAQFRENLDEEDYRTMMQGRIEAYGGWGNDRYVGQLFKEGMPDWNDTQNIIQVMKATKKHILVILAKKDPYYKAWNDGVIDFVSIAELENRSHYGHISHEGAAEVLSIVGPWEQQIASNDLPDEFRHNVNHTHMSIPA